MNKNIIAAVVVVIIVVAAGAAAIVMMNQNNDKKSDITGEWYMYSYEGFDTAGAYEKKTVADDPTIVTYNMRITDDVDGLLSAQYSGRKFVGTYENGILLLKGSLRNQDSERTVVIFGRIISDDVLVFAEMGRTTEPDVSPRGDGPPRNTGEPTQSIYLQIYTRNSATVNFEYPQLSNNWEKSVGYSLGISSATPSTLIGDNITISTQYDSAFTGIMEQATKGTGEAMTIVNRTLTGVLLPTGIKDVINADGYAFDDRGMLWQLMLDDNKMTMMSILETEIDPESNELNSVYRVYTDNGTTESDLPDIMDLKGTIWKVQQTKTMYDNGETESYDSDYTIKFVNQYGPLLVGYWELNGVQGNNAYYLTQDDAGKIYINICSDYSDVFDLGYGWFGDDGKLHLTEVYRDSASRMLAADSTIFAQVD